MKSEIDYLIIGSGLTGSTLARCLSDRGYKVLILERRDHVGGNVHDHLHPSGIRIHTYGPHYFRTSSLKIWQFITRFGSFYNYTASVKSLVEGQYENWPIGASYIRKHIAPDWKPSFCGKPGNFEEAALSLMPEQVYEKFVRGYNIKQWGIDPKLLSPGLIKRFDVRQDDDERLMPHHTYQGLPDDGYAPLMENMIKDIPIIKGIDFLKNRTQFKYKRMLIYTGPIDEYFEHCFGKLKYRGQARKHTYIPEIDFIQPLAQVNNPSLSGGPHIRTIEWKHMMKLECQKEISGTVLTTEIPVTPTDAENYEYPFPDDENAVLYEKYKSLADQQKDLLICGRLGEYKYYDMDQCIGRAFLLLESRILKSKA